MGNIFRLQRRDSEVLCHRNDKTIVLTSARICFTPVITRRWPNITTVFDTENEIQFLPERKQINCIPEINQTNSIRSIPIGPILFSRIKNLKTNHNTVAEISEQVIPENTRIHRLSEIQTARKQVTGFSPENANTICFTSVVAKKKTSRVAKKLSRTASLSTTPN